MNLCNLTFFSTAGNERPAELEIPKNTPINLMPWFKDLFKYYDDRRVSKLREEEWENRIPKDQHTWPKLQEKVDNRFTEDDESYIMKFRFEELLQVTLGTYKTEEFANFLESVMKNPKDFNNDTLLQRIKRHQEVYGLVQFYYNSDYFVIKPKSDNLNIEYLENIVEPKWNTQSQSPARLYDMCNEEGKKPSTTRPYFKRRIKSIKRSLESNKDFKIIVIENQREFLPKLSVIDIISRYDLSQENLELVQRTKTKQISSS